MLSLPSFILVSRDLSLVALVFFLSKTLTLRQSCFYCDKTMNISVTAIQVVLGSSVAARLRGLQFRLRRGWKLGRRHGQDNLPGTRSLGHALSIFLPSSSVCDG